jgi:hypothetical protein
MSYANLPADIVVRACNGYLQARQARIDNIRERAIERLVGTKAWFWSKPLTREQAEVETAEEVYWAEITGGRWARDVADLLSLATMAEKCNTLVTVDAELAGLLKPHFN